MSSQYSFTEFFKTAYSLIMTKITFHQARLIRRPIYLRGAKSIEGGRGLTTGRFCRFDLVGDRKTLFVGDNCEFGDMTHVVAHEKVEFGSDVLVASKCFISDTNHGEDESPEIAPNKRKLVTHPVKIGNKVWIGENVVILAGAEIGDGCIIGANAVVKGYIPDRTIAAGAPARIIKHWDNEKNKWTKC